VNPGYADGGTIDVEGPDGFRMLPDTLLLDLDLLHVDVRLYGLLLWHGRSGNGSYPGRKKLMEELGAKSVRTVDSSLQRLQAKGYLSIIPQYNEDGSQDRNRYRLHFKPLPPELRQKRHKADPDPPTSSQVEGGRNELHGGSPDGGAQLIAPGGGATDCTGGGATDCTGVAQPAAPHKRKKTKRNEVEEKEEPSESFANAQDSAGSAPTQETLGGMPEPAQPPAPAKPAPERLPELTAPPETREEALPYAKQIANDWLAYLKDRKVTVIDRSRGAKQGSATRPFWALADGLFVPALRAGATELEVKKAMKAAFDASGNAVPPWAVFERHLHVAQGTRAATERAAYGKPRTRVHIDEVDQAERDRAAAAFGENVQSAGGTR
jgi:hypothetical protein